MPNDEEKDLKDEEEVEEDETSEDEESSETDGNDQPSEEAPDYKKLYEEEKVLREKETVEKENYRKGLLSRTAKERSLDVELEYERKETPKESPKEVPQTDDLDKRVRSVLYKENERRALRQVIDSTSSSYIPELVADEQYREIIQYLPKGIDRSSETGIVRGLKTAVAAWKFDKGIIEKKPEKKGSKPEETTTTTDGGSFKPKEKKSGRKILKPVTTPAEWY